MKQHKIIILFSIVMFLSLLLSTLTALYSIRKLSKEHMSELLSTVSNDIESSINDKLVEMINVSKTIANDTLLIEMLEREEEASPVLIERRMANYTDRLESTFSYEWVFIASEKSKAYYADTGIYRLLNTDNEEDSWYNEFVDRNEEYYITIGRDNDSPDTWIIFVDVRIENDDGEFLGVCGIAVEVGDLQDMIIEYENKYGIEVLFADADRTIQLESGNIEDVKIPDDFDSDAIDKEQMTITRNGFGNDYTIVIYIEALDWYMIIQDFNPYDRSVDLFLILFNSIMFVVVILITVLGLGYIIRKNKNILATSYRDELTGLYNRRGYEEHLNDIRGRDTIENITVAMFDVNGLKPANDTFGHGAGDELIRGAAEVIREVFAPYGRCYRIGGDEFAAILEREYADVKALKELFDREVDLWQGDIVKKMSISYGMVSASQKGDVTVDELITLADEKMYHRKRKYYKKMRAEKMQGSKK